MKTEDILSEREKTHGDFERFAGLKCALVTECDGYGDYAKLNETQTVAINMILTKVARIFCGDPNHADHWDDIAGYAMLGKGKNETNRDKADRIINEALHQLEEGPTEFEKAQELKERARTCVVCEEERWPYECRGHRTRINDLLPIKKKEEKPKGCYCAAGVMCAPCIKQYVDEGAQEEARPKENKSKQECRFQSYREFCNGTFNCGCKKCAPICRCCNIKQAECEHDINYFGNIPYCINCFKLL